MSQSVSLGMQRRDGPGRYGGDVHTRSRRQTPHAPPRTRRRRPRPRRRRPCASTCLDCWGWGLGWLEVCVWCGCWGGEGRVSQPRVRRKPLEGSMERWIEAAQQASKQAPRQPSHPDRGGLSACVGVWALGGWGWGPGVRISGQGVESLAGCALNKGADPSPRPRNPPTKSSLDPQAQRTQQASTPGRGQAVDRIDWDRMHA